MNIKLIAGSIVALVVLIGGGYYFASNTNSTAQVDLEENAKAVVAEASHDWGKIGINDGNVEATFAVTNEGTVPLKLFNATTSCGCTTVQLFLNEIQSPIYGMHTSSDYVLEVPPGESADLTVIFDPLFHGPNGTGPITRQTFVETNDPQNPRLTFELSADVVEKTD